MALGIVEEAFTRLAEVVEGLVVAVVEHLLVEERPKPFDEFEVDAPRQT